jgi:hypothetical protein
MRMQGEGWVVFGMSGLGCRVGGLGGNLGCRIGGLGSSLGCRIGGLGSGLGCRVGLEDDLF